MRKCGSTTLYHWLRSHPDVYFPKEKELNFFSDERVYQRGLSWYGSLFAEATATQLLGEASVGYMAPVHGAKAARRIALHVPDVKLLVVLRDPVERLRSHYRHELQRGREPRPLVEALSEPDNRYSAQSRYFECLQPYLEHFPREQLCLVSLEELVADGSPAWPTVLAYLGVDGVAAPASAHNVTSEKRPFRPLMRWIWDRGLTPVATRAPSRLRRGARPLLFRSASDYAARLAQSEEPIPESILDDVRADAEQLQREFGISWA